MTDTRQREAIERMALRRPEDLDLKYEGQLNDDPVQRPEYPRMMYRATSEEDRLAQTDSAAKCGETWLVVNNYGTAKEPMLCDIRVAATVDEAEALAAEGWEISPHAAHGKSDGIARATSAKDDEIARLRADLEAARTPERRGPGRPPKSDAGE